MKKAFKLTGSKIEKYNNEGYFVCKNLFTKKEIKNIIKWTNEVEDFKEEKGKWMKYYDRSLTNSSKYILTRIENFYDYHKNLKKTLSQKKIINLIETLFQSKVYLFKDKINFKYPGAKGFKAHQDATIWKDMYGIKEYITLLISIDNSNLKNGCLEVAKKSHKNGLLGKSWKEMSKSAEKKLKWEPIQSSPGDIMIFNDYTPHRSANNYSKNKRRIIFLTYNKKSEGNHRKKHFKDKRANFPPNIERVNGKKYVFHI